MEEGICYCNRSLKCTIFEWLITWSVTLFVMHIPNVPMSDIINIIIIIIIIIINLMGTCIMSSLLHCSCLPHLSTVTLHMLHFHPSITECTVLLSNIEITALILCKVFCCKDMHTIKRLLSSCHFIFHL